ncbi:MAG: hypothetical protein WCH10_03720 [bacterium]
MDNKVNVVFISDYEAFEIILGYFRSKTTAEMYNDPETFLESLSQYDKDTKICIDNSLKTKIGSFELAERLYNAGYAKLYLLSGWDFKNGGGPRDVPHYLTTLFKGINIIEELDRLL